MAGGKETPRQKMIGMMYLVLTALLALNVSKSILDSFVRVNESLETTNKNFAKKNEKLYGDFESKHASDKEKVGPFWNNAQEIRDSAKSMIDHIDSMKTFLKAEVEGIPWKKADTLPLSGVSSKDNYDVPTNKLGVSTPNKPKGKDWEGSSYTAKELSNKLDSYRSFLKTLLAMDRKNGGANKDTSAAQWNLESLATKGNPESLDPAAQTWEGLNFYHAPIAATITALSKIQSDVKNAESDVVSALMSQVGAEDFSFDTLAPKVIPLNGSYIAVGDTYKAEVIVAAWNTTRDPELNVGQEIDDSTGELTGPADTSGSSINNGLGYYEFVPEKQGQIKWGGEIAIQGPSGEKRPFSIPPQTVRAADQNVVVSPTKMNALYRGLPNPISISVPGLAAEDLKASMSNGSLSQKGAGQYTAKPGKGNKATITVSDKSGKRLGDMDFRVKDVPRPEPFFAGRTTTDNSVTRNRLKVSDEVTAELGDDFLFEGVQYKVVEFEVGATIGGQFPTERQQGSGKLSARQKELLAGAERGGRIEVRNIVALDPSGKRRNLSSLSFDVK